MTSTTSKTAENGSTGGIQSVDRALQVLELLAGWGEGGVTELAGELGVHKSTAFRLLGALEAREMVEQTEDRGKYRLGFGLVRLARRVNSQLDLTKHARAVTEPLADELGETVNLAVLREHYAVNVDQTLGAASVVTQNWVGQLTPLHATSSGKVLLAHVSREERDTLIKAAGGLAPFTEATHTDREALEDELERVLEQGHATTSGELEVGLNAIAVPVYGEDGTVVAALSASGPAYRLTPQRIAGITERMHEAGVELSRRLGHLPAAD